MIVRVELSTMSGCKVMSGDDVVVVWCLTLWLGCLCLVICGPRC